MIKRFTIIMLVFIIIIWHNCRAQICTTLVEREHISCMELSEVGEDMEHYILFQYNEHYYEESSYCTKVENSDYSSGRIEIKYPNITNGNINCVSISIKFKCTDCEQTDGCTTVGQSECIGTCNCECMVKCLKNQVRRVRTISTLVSNETLFQAPASTTASTNLISSTLPTYSIRTNGTYLATATNASTKHPVQHNSTQTANTSTVLMSNQIPTKLPFNIPQYILYGVPVGCILLIELTAFLVSLFICAWYRGKLRKSIDCETINMNEQLVEENRMTTQNDTTCESTYFITSELVPTSDLPEINVITNRFTYSECLEAEQASSPDQIIQNELYNFGNTNESERENRTEYYLEKPNNLYHVLVAGEVVESSIYDKITENNPLYFSSRASDMLLANNCIAIRDTFIEPPNNLPELKNMLDTCLHEISEADIEIGEEFASGHFGMVYRGNYHTGKGDIPVAIKTLKEKGVTDTDKKLVFMREAAILAQFHHPNVLRLIGILTGTHQPWMIVTELLKTELRQFLLNIKLTPADPSTPDKLQIQNLLLKFSREIAAGMQHLAEKKFIHRDLAARNVLVAKDMSVRVADFGMSREIDNENDYYTSSGGRVPLRWTAPEALFYKKFSEKSDVWSFGMTLYEIWSLGNKPWQGYENEEIIEALSTGHTLSQTVNCPIQVYQVMLDTWKQEKDSRPNFTQLKKELNKIILS